MSLGRYSTGATRRRDGWMPSWRACGSRSAGALGGLVAWATSMGMGSFEGSFKRELGPYKGPTGSVLGLDVVPGIF